jgi:hypothetical protein
MIEIILETNRGVVFEKTTSKNRCNVTIKNKNGSHTHTVYRFNNIAEPFASPFISWENLNCCNGWIHDESYLLTAVQNGRKLCSGITFDNENSLTEYINHLNNEYPYYCPPPMLNGAHTFYYHYIDVVREGAIRDYIDGDSVFRTYDKLGIRNFDKEIVSRYMGTTMLELVSGKLDYSNPKTPEELIATGLLLGYPLESTAWLLEQR